MKQLKLVTLGSIIATLIAAFGGRVRAQTTAFTYQGRLFDNGSASGGKYDLRFMLYNASTGGSAFAGPVTNSATVISNGLFTVLLDFGTGVFTGSPLWLEIGVRTNGGAVSFATLTPRQALTATPYALYSPNAGIANGVAPGSITASSIASGQVVKSINGLKDAVTVSAGANVTLATNGSNLTISSTGGGVFALNGTSAYYNAGNVGIGTTTPDHPMTIQSPAGGTTPILWRNPSYELGALGWNTDANSGWLGLESSGNWKVSILANGSSYFNGGNVGIGTISPQSALHVFGTVRWGGWSPTTHAYSDIDGAGLFLEQVGASVATSKIRLQSSRSGGLSAYSQFFLDPENGFAFLGSGGANGNVGIGTTSPAAALHVNGDIIASPNDHGNPANVVLTAGSVDGTALYCHSYGTPFHAHNDYTGTDVYLAGGVAGSFTGGLVVSGNATVNGEATMCVCTITGGCDVSEPFQLSGQEVPKGAVVTIDRANPGQLKLSAEAYDKRVAGIVSGANGVNPGIRLSQQGIFERGENVALSGRVYALADASQQEIEPGDLLTTSATPGHCMKATDHVRAQGAIIGKAMSSLKEGKGMVLVLVSLQ